MGALTDLWKSERGLLAALTLIAAGVLAGMSVLTADQWMDFTKFIFLTYVGGKTVTGAVSIWKGSPDAVPVPVDPETTAPIKP